ncbi:MAG: YfcE family phosphodiesterase [Candidatus Aenigmarchaeota archaeon]|nr:YfcE family phosphodiesterase [Candidatus Aenigmarchaeota archaeon]MDW8149421.1 YfcE family phosphodiesterase [Candidatus Aenigmarchaeota archaeon]
MKKILAISDSHINSLDKIPSELIKKFNEFDYVVHCGDFTTKKVVEEFKEFKNFIGTVGNVDDYEIENILEKEVVLDINGFKIGITHPYEGGPPVNIKERILKKFRNEKMDLIIFGHTHFVENSEYNSVKFVNPGSCTGKFPALFRSYAIIEIEEKINVKIVKY